MLPHSKRPSCNARNIANRLNLSASTAADLGPPFNVHSVSSTIDSYSGEMVIIIDFSVAVTAATDHSSNDSNEGSRFMEMGDWGIDECAGWLRTVCTTLVADTEVLGFVGAEDLQ